MMSAGTLPNGEERLVVEATNIYLDDYPSLDVDARVHLMTSIPMLGGSRLASLVLDLNKRLTLDGFRGLGEEFVNSGLHRTGLTLTLGLRNTEGLAGRVGEHLSRTSARVVSEVVAGGGDVARAIGPLAAMGSMAIARGQTYRGGNKRTARGVAGYMVYGNREGIIAGSNAFIDFSMPRRLELAVLVHNTGRLLGTGEQEAYPTPPDSGDMQIEASVEELIGQAKVALDGLRLPDGENEGTVFQRYNLFLEKFSEQIPTGKLLAELLAVLMQYDYGPAACAVALGEADPAQITEEDAERIIKANRKLVALRAMTLISGVADGNLFTITTSGPDKDSRKRTAIPWRPYSPELDLS